MHWCNFHFQLWVKVTCDSALVLITEYLIHQKFLRGAVSLKCKMPSIYIVQPKVIWAVLLWDEDRQPLPFDILCVLFFYSVQSFFSLRKSLDVMDFNLNLLDSRHCHKLCTPKYMS